MLLVYVEDHPGAIAVGGIGRRHRRCKEDDGHRFHRNCRYPSGLPNQEGAMICVTFLVNYQFAASRSSRSRGAPCTDRLGKDVWELCVPASCRWMGKEAYVSWMVRSAVSYAYYFNLTLAVHSEYMSLDWHQIYLVNLLHYYRKRSPSSVFVYLLSYHPIFSDSK